MTAAKAREDMTAQAEDYLKAIYEIEGAAGVAGTTEIAQRLAIAPASVSGMVRRLAEQGLLELERYHGVTLTDAGRRAALRMLRRHRVIEVYLVRLLGYSWDSVHEEAERLEHAASEELIDRMAAVLGEPTVDPHGAPIPTRDGAIEEIPQRALSTLAIGDSARVVQVRDGDPALLQYLEQLDLTPGNAVRIMARAPFDGPITLEVEGTERVIGPSAAAQVLVSLAEGGS